jgi:azurin
MQRMMIKAACALAWVALSSCGGSDKREPTPAAPTPTPAPQANPAPAPAAAPEPAAPPAKPDEAGVVHISGSDQMRYSATQIEVVAGKVKIEMKNLGALPKEAMGHDMVVLKPGSDVTAFAAKAMTAKATDYIPADAGDQMIAHTRLLGPGESQIIEFEVAAGSYPFLCTFPGHVGLMNGVLLAK